MCLLGCDALFERGLVQIRGGRVVTNPGAHGTDDLRKVLARFRKLGRLSPLELRDRRRYLAWHSKHAGRDSD